MEKIGEGDSLGALKDHSQFIAILTARIVGFSSEMIQFLVGNLQNGNNKQKVDDKKIYDTLQNYDKESLLSKKTDDSKRKYAKARSRLPVQTNCERPKAPTSSFLIYYHENKKQLASRFGQTNVSKLTKLASSVWKGLPESERMKYQKISEESKERYQKQMEAFKVKHHDKIEEALKKRRAQYRMNWLTKKRAKEIKDKENLSDNSELSFDLSGQKDLK